MDHPVFNPVSQCQGKATFSGFALADRAAKRVGRKHGEPMCAYRCPHCSQFHVGTDEPLVSTKLYRMKKRLMKETA